MKAIKTVTSPQSQGRILIVDDDPNILEVLKARLDSVGYEVFEAPDPLKGLKHLKSQTIDLVISDIKMPSMDGMTFLKKAQAVRPDLPLIFITAYGTIPDAVEAMKAGAIDYIAKPFDGSELLKKVKKTIARAADTTSGQDTSADDTLPYKGNNKTMQDLDRLIDKIADSSINVLLLGESGVGKERVAQMIHRRSSRHQGHLVVVDCGATPVSLLESELFGHVKGAFTHAVTDKRGLIEGADGGTLFLDEIGNISAEMQIRLLRFLETRKIRRIGDLKEIEVDCRVLSATNADLINAIKEKEFREDLYYRLRGVTLHIPPLRERKEDIVHLAQTFAANYCREQDLAPVTITPETLAYLDQHCWPGNVRELKNAIETGAALCRDSRLRVDDLQLSMECLTPTPAPAEMACLSLEEAEKSTIVNALQQTGGVQSRAAELLGISRRAIHYKIKKYGIEAKKVGQAGA